MTRQHPPRIAHLHTEIGSRLIKITVTIKPKGLETTYHIYVYPPGCTLPGCKEEITSGTVSKTVAEKVIKANTEGEPTRQNVYQVEVVAENTAGQTSKLKAIR